MNINYDNPFNFKPIPSITPASDYWQNGTWKFNMSEITAGTTSQPSWIDIILHGTTALTLVNAKANGLNYLKLFGGTEQVSGTYLDSVTLSGGTEQNGTPTPTTPMDIVCNNGALKANTNIYWTEYKDYQLSRTDGITVISAPDVNVSGMVDCRTIKSFKITTISQQGSFRIFKYGIDNTFINATSTANIGNVITFGDNVGFFRIQYNYIATGTENILIYNSAYDLNGIYTQGTVETVTDSNGLTANAERLLAVGNYKDTQEVLSGSVTRNVGIKVLDGTETWTRYAQITGGYLFYTENAITDNKLGEAYTDLYCTHAVPGSMETWALNICRFAINSETGDVAGHRLYFSTSEATTVDGFKTWLATQCANGTPVIIVYPLATATTETVTGQSLSKSPVTQTAGSISNLPIATTESVHTIPTPQRPLPINCNNGALKVHNKSGLPLGYQAVEYIESTGTQYIDTGIIPNVTTRVVAKIAFPEVTDTVLCWGSRSSGTYQSSLDQFYCGRTFALLWYYTAKTQIGICSDVNPNIFYDIDVTNTRVTATATQSIYLFALNNLGTATTGSSSKIAKFKIYNNGVMVRDLISCKRKSDNAPGMYDLVSGQFFTNQGTGVFIAGADVDDMGIYTDGTVETVNVHGKNLFDYSAIGTIIPDPAGTAEREGIIIKGLKAGTYTFSCKPTSGFDVNYIRLANGVRVDGSPAPRITSSPAQITLTGEMDEIRFWVALSSSWALISDVQLEQGSTATTYEPYFNGGNATAEILLKVGEYKDVQEVLTGSVTRNVGIKVLDGTEDWDNSAAGTLTDYRVLRNSNFFPSNIPKPQPWFVTHFTTSNSSIYNVANQATRYNGTSTQVMFCISESLLGIDSSATQIQAVNAFNQWLADQYNAGHPVIIVYPLATSTTETVTSRSLTTQAGTNIVEITQASINNLELEVSYKAGVEVTITEVQNAQLDNSVEVTIA